MAFVSRIKDNNDFLKEIRELSRQYKCVDLGLGFPNYPPPKFITDALSDVLLNGSAEDHQYTNPNGHPKLIAAFSKMYSQLLNRNLDPNSEILITAGSSEALFCAIMGLVSPGDEVIIIEPYFLVFETLVNLAGGIPRFVSIKMEDNIVNPTTDDWKFNKKELEESFNAKTKVVIINTPHNPTGKVFTLEELTLIADLCKKWNVICIADDVYERMVYRPKIHIRISTLPGMFEKTITIGALEKSFGVTGWQIGYGYGPHNLLKSLQVLHQHTVYNASTPLQLAFAKILEDEYSNMGTPYSYFDKMEEDLREKRNFVLNILRDANFNPISPDGGMFVMSDISKLAARIRLSKDDNKEYLDLKFVKQLMKKHSLQTFPTSIFCSETNKQQYAKYIRFCFVKSKNTLEDAADILNNFLKNEECSK